ncbi:cytochrome c [Novosphingobium chloroacetimidivorans]|uniref:Cytochrome c n=1 Tax=Novosphingobium chloroacetimidivorans TaxID=1428314 RepID=A0A7W7K7L2_9SPHN|nr:cytochrome c [Novosphingobium chloroacetimidivorans]MBB4857732.1 cytochrome c [Novosphingobium chloroacetimidivorans]
MSTPDRVILGGVAALALSCAAVYAHLNSRRVDSPQLGRPASPDVIRRMDISVGADGGGLPPGAGTVAQGRATYAAKCQMCHGEAGTGGIADPLTGGIGSLATAKPVKTVASYWPYAPPLFDYIRRAMPLTAPQSLKDDEVYGLVAYLLSVDGIVAPDARLDAGSLTRIRMPNRKGFISLEDRDFDGNAERIAPPVEGAR